MMNNNPALEKKSDDNKYEQITNILKVAEMCIIIRVLNLPILNIMHMNGYMYVFDTHAFFSATMMQAVTLWNI